ncbi:uncharacterized protein IUM83_08338, partial [Phytophthora cinnamomi]|uniref:uncharacterized protein n=1 Tax=Phytophthora cinnamomi TaxID=4785 RepID=UPI0035599E43
ARNGDEMTRQAGRDAARGAEMVYTPVSAAGLEGLAVVAVRELQRQVTESLMPAMPAYRHYVLPAAMMELVSASLHGRRCASLPSSRHT